MNMLVLLNRAAGSATDDAPERIVAAFARHGVTADVRAVDADALGATARAATNEPFDAIVGCGGDGTLNTVAAALAGTSMPFGVLPLGTYNHFARELGIPLEIDEAAAALATAAPSDIDVAEVNGRLFLNFTGIGFHPTMVQRREEEQQSGRRKFVAMLLAIVRVLGRLPILRVGLASQGARPEWRITPSVIVCTNAFQMKAFGVERLSYPDRGVLNVYLAATTRWYDLVVLFVRGLLGALASAKNFEARVLPDLTIHLHRRQVEISIDGELTELRTPLVFKIRRGGLRVLVPAPAAETAPLPPAS
ncbi:MAG: diacylglycerol kinase family protein [Myxococcota bacterium]